MNLQKFIEQAKKANIFYDGEVKDIDSIVDMLSPSRPLLYWTMELYDKEEGRSVPYLCDEARSVFSFLENSHVRKAGKSVGTYLLRLVKTVHVRFQP